MAKYRVNIKYQKRANKNNQELYIAKDCLKEALPELICILQCYHRTHTCDDIKELKLTRIEVE